MINTEIQRTIQRSSVGQLTTIVPEIQTISREIISFLLHHAISHLFSAKAKLDVDSRMMHGSLCILSSKNNASLFLQDSLTKQRGGWIKFLLPFEIDHCCLVGPLTSVGKHRAAESQRPRDEKCSVWKIWQLWWAQAMIFFLFFCIVWPMVDIWNMC